MAVLRAVTAGESAGSGVGRERLLQTLRAQGLRLSDVSLRKLLRELAEEGLLAIGSGRQGTRLTDAGRCALTRPELPQSVCPADKYKPPQNVLCVTCAELPAGFSRRAIPCRS